MEKYRRPSIFSLRNTGGFDFRRMVITLAMMLGVATLCKWASNWLFLIGCGFVATAMIMASFTVNSSVSVRFSLIIAKLNMIWHSAFAGS
jgi:hypothetical protein